MHLKLKAGTKNSISLLGAIFLGIGSMVGAGIFALFGEAGAIAGAAVWVSFLIGGIIALLQGYSFAKLGARYPSAGGMIAWIVRGFGKGLFTGGVVMLGYFSVLIVTAMVAVTFGNYATDLFLGENANPIWVKIFAAAIIILLTFVNSIGAEAVTKAQTVIVSIVLVILSGFAIAMLANMNPALLAPASLPLGVVHPGECCPDLLRLPGIWGDLFCRWRYRKPQEKYAAGRCTSPLALRCYCTWPWQLASSAP